MNLKLIGVIVAVSIVAIGSYYISTGLTENTEKKGYFEKNRVCVQSKNDIEKELEELNVTDESQEERLLEVFYSKEYDSCMYIVELTQNVFGYSDGWKSTKRLMDYRVSLNSTPINTCEYISSERMYQSELLSIKNREKALPQDTSFLESEYKRIKQDNCKIFEQRITELKNI